MSGKKYWIKGKSCSPSGHSKKRQVTSSLATQSSVGLPRYTSSKLPPGTSKQNTPNTFGNLDKYILLFGKYTLHVDNFLFAIWTNAFSNLAI